MFKGMQGQIRPSSHIISYFIANIIVSYRDYYMRICMKLSFIRDERYLPNVKILKYVKYINEYVNYSDKYIIVL